MIGIPIESGSSINRSNATPTRLDHEKPSRRPTENSKPRPRKANTARTVDSDGTVAHPVEIGRCRMQCLFAAIGFIDHA